MNAERNSDDCRNEARGVCRHNEFHKCRIGRASTTFWISSTVIISHQRRTEFAGRCRVGFGWTAARSTRRQGWYRDCAKPCGESRQLAYRRGALATGASAMAAISDSPQILGWDCRGSRVCRCQIATAMFPKDNVLPRGNVVSTVSPGRGRRWRNAHASQPGCQIVHESFWMRLEFQCVLRFGVLVDGQPGGRRPFRP